MYYTACLTTTSEEKVDEKAYLVSYRFVACIQSRFDGTDE